jgi:Fic family protein
MSKKIGETTYKETAFGLIPRSKLIPLEIEGTKRAWDFIIKKVNSKKFTITVDFIKEIHNIGFGWIFPEIGGKFRNVEVKVSGHIPPKFYLVPQLMADFTADLKIRLKNLPKINKSDFFEKSISLIAWAHHRFLWIHPFTDYNGRIGRLLNSAILLSLDLPPIELKVETKSGRIKYVFALQAADNGNYSYLEKIIQKAMEEALKEVE